MSNADVYVIAKADLDLILNYLQHSGFSTLGPTVADGAIVYEPISSINDLPFGYGDSQTPGEYRLKQSSTHSYFEFNVGPHSWKQFLFPSRQTIADARLDGEGWHFTTPIEVQPKYAFVGVRACELAAIAVQDRVFLQGPYVDPIYEARRKALFIVAVNCTVAASTCFCSSMQTGPECQQGFDLALTELDDGFLIQVGSAQGADAIAELNKHPADARSLEQGQRLRQRALDQIDKQLDTTDIRNLLLQSLDHPRWDQVASRCLSCTNCTMVCPTCFCSTVSEVSDLSGEHVRRERAWDSCFNIDFGYTASGVVRNDRRSRYRQWLTHKLASWHDQFDTSGCVGCGRCITWCPVGIDLTEEVANIRDTPKSERILAVPEPNLTACTVVSRDLHT
jgi:Fe-S-cluster-containing hydrogenase component 2